MAEHSGNGSRDVCPGIIAYTMLKTGRSHHEPGGNYLERIAVFRETDTVTVAPAALVIFEGGQ